MQISNPLKKKKNNKNNKNFLGQFGSQVFLTLLIFISLIAIYGLIVENRQHINEITISELARDISEVKVSSIIVKGDKLEIEYLDGERSISRKEADTPLSQTLINYGLTPVALKDLDISVENPTGWGYWALNLLPFLLPIAFIIFLFWMITRQVKGASMQAFSFGQSKARMINPNDKQQKVLFKDVAGVKEAKEELLEIVEFLRSPAKFLNIGARIPKGVILMGPPGAGKTLLARAIAGEAHVPFFYLSGSEFVEMFVGVGASVTGDTPVLIKNKDGRVKLLLIADLVDKYYQENEEGVVKIVADLKTLGFEKKKTARRGSQGDKTYFGNSKWSTVKGVYRHKVDKIYKINYLGGSIRATGDHSVFIRKHNYITAKKVSELKSGDVLVQLPFKVRGAFKSGFGTTHSVRAHNFDKLTEEKYLSLYDKEYQQAVASYNLVCNSANMSRSVVASSVGVSEGTVANWQNNIQRSRFFSNNLLRINTPSKVKITPELMRLLGHYTAEGRVTQYTTQFVFGSHEKKLHKDCINLLKDIFKLEPTTRLMTDTNSFRISVHSPYIARFFERLCGTGSYNKKLPEFIWELPVEYFNAYLKGYSDGGGYTTKEGKLSITSVSKRLIRELSWLCSMHGLPVDVRECISPSRIIRPGSKSTPPSRYWNLIIGKSSHPFQDYQGTTKQLKKAVIRDITEEEYDGYVYDLCGCDNEAFFGGERPILLHNSRVRDLFQMAKKAAPAIIFIDEIDAIGRHRGSGMGGGNDEREQTLNQILVEMDGFEPHEKLIVVAATNRPDVLDTALLRPGRFDRRVILDLPDINDREAILKIHARKKPLAESVNLRTVAQRTPGFTGADLNNVMNEAAILAARENRQEIIQDDLLRSIEKVMLGPERKSHVLSEHEKKITAYHEIGHALVASLIPEADPIHKVSIISRGHAAGYTLKLPFEDRKLNSRKEFLADLAMSLGGYTAEKLVFDDITTGAGNDIRVATALARDMVVRYGMSDKIGPVAYDFSGPRIHQGEIISNENKVSEDRQKIIDEEVSRLMSEALKKAENILKENRQALDEMSAELIKRETLERKDFEDLLLLHGIRPKEENNF